MNEFGRKFASWARFDLFGLLTPACLAPMSFTATFWRDTAGVTLVAGMLFVLRAVLLRRGGMVRQVAVTELIIARYFAAHALFILYGGLFHRLRSLAQTEPHSWHVCFLRTCVSAAAGIRNSWFCRSAACASLSFRAGTSSASRSCS